MKQVVLFFIFMTLSSIMLTQTNLVLNSGFEKSKYPTRGTRELKKPGYLANNWFVSHHKRSPHLYINPDKNVAKANSGSAAVGFVFGGEKKKKSKVEYLTGELAAPLVKGQTYCVCFHVLLHRSSTLAASNIGVLFHRDQNLIANVPDLKSLEADLYIDKGGFVTNTKWQKYCGYYVGSGGEQFISLGKFGNGEIIEVAELSLEPYSNLDGLKSKAYYQMDDISVIAQNDSVSCGCAEPLTEEDVVSMQTKVLQPFLFVLDVSGSMKKNSLYDSLRNNMVDLLNKIPVGSEVTFTTFSSSSKVVYSGKVDSKTSSVVDSILSKVKLGGGTNVYEGLGKSVKSLVSEGKDSAQIVLISDGNFTVSNKIEDVVREEFVTHGRRLTVIHIDSKAKDSERLIPYQTTFIHVSPSELSNAVYQVFRKKSFGAVTCGCEDTYSEVMNYHFVVDYSGSMAFHKGRARKALSHLYEQVPDNAVVSITAFSNKASELYVGNRSDLPNENLEGLLASHKIGGGTNPTPGVKHGLEVAKRMAELRFSHVILVTDLRSDNLNELVSMKNRVGATFEEIDMTFSTLTVDLQAHLDLMVSGRTQFDVTSGMLRDVSKAKFEKDLFETDYSSCDYSTQPYHYNPFGDMAKDGAKKTLKFILRELMKGGGVSVGL